MKLLTKRRRQILSAIVDHQRERGYPPSLREIAKKVGLKSPASVKTHLDLLAQAGYVRVDPTRPRAIEVCYDENTGAAVQRRPVRHVPLVGDVAAGTGVLAAESVEELVPMPADLTGAGELFMLRVRGDSMIEAGILDGDYVVCRAQSTASDGEIVVAGTPDDEATVKTLRRGDGRVILEPANAEMAPMSFDPAHVRVYGKVVTLMRKL